MAIVVHKTTFQVLRSVNTPDYPTDDWLINPAGLVTLESGNVPSKYWKLNGTSDDIEEKTQGEKDTQDAADLPADKAARRVEVDDKDVELIGNGFSFDGKVFSLSEESQLNWMSLVVKENNLTWPVEITTNNDEAYSLTQVNMPAFTNTATGTKQAHLDSGRALKVSIDAAADQTALDAIVDGRSGSLTTGQVSATNLVTTTTSTKNTIGSMTFTITSDGDYLFMFHSRCRASNKDTSGEFSIFNEGVEITNSIQGINDQTTQGNDGWFEGKTQALITGLVNTDVVDVRFKRSSGAGNIQVDNRSFIFIKVA